MKIYTFQQWGTNLKLKVRASSLERGYKTVKGLMDEHVYVGEG